MNISDKTARIKKHIIVASVQRVGIVAHDKSIRDVIPSELPEHLQSLFFRSCERLSEKEKSLFLDLLIHFGIFLLGLMANLGERIL